MQNKNIKHKNQTFSIKEAIKFGWEKTKKYWLHVITFNIIYFVIVFGMSTIVSTLGFDEVDPNVPLLLLGQILIAIITYILIYNLTKIYLNMSHNRHYKIKDLLKADTHILKNALRLFAVMILLSFATMLGLLLFIIPGIIIAIRFSMAYLILVEKDVDIIQAFRLSWRMTKDNVWKMLGLSLISFAIIIVGFIAFVVGIVPAAIIISFSQYYVYIKLSENLEEPIKTHKLETAS